MKSATKKKKKERKKKKRKKHDLIYKASGHDDKTCMNMQSRPDVKKF